MSSTNTNGDINITPAGSGNVVLDGLSWPTSDGAASTVLTTDGAGNLSFSPGGDVVGPGSSTNNAVVRWDCITGKFIQDSGIIIDDGDSITGVVDLTATGDITAEKFISPSDIKIKKDISSIDIDDGLNNIMQLRPVVYKFTKAWQEQNGLKNDKWQRGLIAQEVQEILPEIVVKTHGDILTINYQRIVVDLIAAIQRQQVEIDELKVIIGEGG